MKKLFAIIIVVFFAFHCFAQTDNDDDHLLGIRGGYRMFKMVFTYEGYDEYKDSWTNGTSFGLYSRHRLKDNLFLRGDLVFTKRGVSLKWDDVKYKIDANYFDIRLPFQYVFQSEGWGVNPYIYAGPSIDFASSGEITYKSNFTSKVSEDLNKNNFASLDIGLLAGIGLDIPITISSLVCRLSIEAGIDLGLLNTFSSEELDGDADVANPELSNEKNYETRKNRGFEAAVAFSIPIVETVGKVSSRIKKRQAQRQQTQTVLVEQPVKEETVVEEKPEWVEQECYSIEDIAKMADKGNDICGLRICFFDIQFNYNSASLDTKSLKKLEPVAELIKKHSELTVTINGHTDSIGSEQYNKELSVKRAKSVADYLISKGAPESRVKYYGFGLKYPIDSNKTKQGRQRNRRVEIEFSCKE